MNPTKKQKAMLDFIDGFIKGNGYSPTLREIMQALGYKSVSTVAKHVDNLIARGWMIKRDGEARSLEVVGVSSVEEKVASDEVEAERVVELISKRMNNLKLDEADKHTVQKALKLLGLVEVEDEEEA